MCLVFNINKWIEIRFTRISVLVFYFIRLTLNALDLNNIVLNSYDRTELMIFSFSLRLLVYDPPKLPTFTSTQKMRPRIASKHSEVEGEQLLCVDRPQSVFQHNTKLQPLTEMVYH